MATLTSRVIPNIEAPLNKVLRPGLLPATFAVAPLPPVTVTGLPGGAFPPFRPPPQGAPHAPPHPHPTPHPMPPHPPGPGHERS